ncbi:hypothetical protein ACVBE9_11740 [Eionea flava]
MAEFQEYSASWLLYGIAVIGLLAVTWRISQWIRFSYLRGIVLVTAAVLFLTPVVAENSYWAPAWIVAVLELLFSDLETILPILRMLLIVWLVALISYTVIKLVFLRKPKEKKKKVSVY